MAAILFKVESISELQNIATRIGDRATEMDGVRTKAMSSLSSLQGNIVCDGIKETLGSLSAAIDGNTTAVNTLFSEISQFIDAQMIAYNEANAAAKSDVGGVQGSLESING